MRLKKLVGIAPYRGIVNAGAGRIIVEPSVDGAQIEFMANKVVQRKLERVRLVLLVQHKGGEHPAEPLWNSRSLTQKYS